MHKIAILTTSHAINYGAVLQAFSLKMAIEENINSEVDIINYCGDEAVAGRKIFRKNSNIKNIAINLMVCFRYKYRKNRKELCKLFDEFKVKYLGISSELITNRNELKKLNGYDAFVCGSDQLWNLNLSNDTTYFLDFVNDNVRKVAYAVSISERLSDVQMNMIAKMADDFKSISIREYDDAQILSKIMKRDIENVIDPVFLHDANEWGNMLSLSNEKVESYVFVFLISHDDLDQKVIDAIKSNRKIVVLNLHPVKYVIGDKEINVCNPNKFVEYIANADTVITDSFHCTAFSIIFKKDFYNIKRSRRRNRIENLYKKLSIPSRFADPVNIPLEPIDYSKVNFALKKETLKGKKFIIENLGKSNYDKI